MPADRSHQDASHGRTAVDWAEAYTYFTGLPSNQRSYRAVAERFGVSVRTVERHGRRERWRERAAMVDADAIRQADRKLGRARADQLADFHRLIEASCIAYARQLASGRVRVTASDLVGLMKMSLQLFGQADSRGELSPGSAEWSALRTRILAAVADHPDARLALAQALDDTDPA